MGEVVDLKDYSFNRAVRRGQGLWRACFPETLTNRTRLADLSDKTLLTLARLEGEVMMVVFDLVMGVLGLGPGAGFKELDGEPKLKVLDVSLFLIDQVRWECMRRLGWISGFPAEKYGVIELILDCEAIKSGFDPPVPQLSRTHPKYVEFDRSRALDGEMVLRGLIPAALAAFGQKV